MGYLRRGKLKLEPGEWWQRRRMDGKS
jgi:hypothetical protein